MSPAAANHVAARMLMGFVFALAALLLGMVLIRRMRRLVDEEFMAEPRPEPALTGRLEHRPILPPKSSTK